MDFQMEIHCDYMDAYCLMENVMVLRLMNVPQGMSTLLPSVG